jgi:integrase
MRSKLTDTECRTAKPEATRYKKSDGGGLRLLVQPNGSKLWRMAYRFGGRHKELAFGQYPTISLSAAREARDDARKLLAKGIDPAAAKLEAKRERAAARTYAEWAAEWLVKEAKEHNASGKPRDEKTMSGKTRYVGYLNSEFGKSLMSAIKRADALLFLRKIEQTGKLETRDRIRATGEAIFAYANLDDSGGNPFRKFDKHQLLKNVSTPRPALINERSGAVAKLFQTIAAPYGRARFSDLVGHALRFISLTVVRPGEIASAEWTDFSLDDALWTISAEKMKMTKEHIVPLSRQAIAILEQVEGLTGNRQYVFSCGSDDPISDNTLCKRLRDLGYDTSKEHCAHGFRTTFSTLMNGETDRDENKMWDGDVIELQLAHLDESSVKAIYNRTGPLSLIGARAKLLQHWADRVDKMAANNVVPIERKTLLA